MAENGFVWTPWGLAPASGQGGLDALRPDPSFVNARKEATVDSLQRWQHALKADADRFPFLLEVEEGLSRRLADEKALTGFFELVSAIQAALYRKELCNPDRFYYPSLHRVVDVHTLYLTTVFGLPSHGHERFLSSRRQQTDFSDLEPSRRPNIVAFWEEISSKTRLSPLLTQERWVVRHAGLPGVFALLFLMDRSAIETGFSVSAMNNTEKLGPEVGIIFSPSNEATVRDMLLAARTQPGELVLDLGSGDGRTLLCAAKDFSARAKGVEFSPILLDLSRWRIEEQGLRDRISVRWADLFSQDLSEADVITCYLSSEIMEKLADKFIREVKPGARVVSISFSIPKAVAQRATITTMDVPWSPTSERLTGYGQRSLHIAQF